MATQRKSTPNPNMPERTPAGRPDTSVDIVAITSLKEKYPPIVTDDYGLTARYAIALLSRLTDGNALVTLGVGQHQMPAMQHYRVHQPALSCLRSPQPCEPSKRVAELCLLFGLMPVMVTIV